MFGNQSYHTIDDPFEKKIGVSSRLIGKQMVAGAPDPKILADSRLAHDPKHGDKYVEPGTVERQAQIEREKKKLTPAGFRYTSPAKKSSGTGNYYGTFSEGKPFKHESDEAPAKGGSGPPPPQPRNMITSPAKKGTYGFPGVVLGKGDEFKYDVPLPKSKGGRKKKQTTVTLKPIGPPFKTTCKTVDFFDTHPNVGASKIYGFDKPLGPRPTESKKKDGLLAGPFKPSHSNKGTIGQYYEYKPDPYDAKDSKKKGAPPKPTVSWKPVGGSRSQPVRSVVLANVR
eukprot:NODE_2028_length_1319_cov_38.228346_g1844_i0.p1 GENE.NODE_2028_length_1319_cov_38.228346_g1844_i0~~NODE_2028_length_1319_cov_38.228346_g1844_i0.p1  ORF type:complete len:284 (+),score=38.11 NODE_2028_length_1319_cov_38.228346_g1844_i0:224-1075(+)